MLQYKRLPIIVIVLAVMPWSDLARQSPEAAVLRLARIKVVGAAHYTGDQIIAISGLKEGQPVRKADLEAAVDRLMASGFFRSVTYRYAYTGIDAVVTLEVTEDKFRVLVIFDNFVWFKDQELLEAIRQQVTGFDGTSPGSKAALDAIKEALQELLQRKSVDGQVEYTGQTDLYGRGQLEIFSVKGAEFPVCGVEFQGVGSARLAEIKEKSRPLLKGLYSRAFTSAFVRGNLIPVYRSKGYLRASFQESEATVSDDAKCQHGVTLRLAVDEGSPYTWLKAEWAGNTVLPSSQLDALIPLSPGELANGLKLDSGLASVREAYGGRGYIGLKIGSQAEYDDREHRVAFKFDVEEGPQYHMGQLSVTGLSDRDAARVKAKWKLAEGAVFNASYFKEFVTKELSGQSLSGVRDFDVSTRPDRQTLKVDILIAATGNVPKN